MVGKFMAAMMELLVFILLIVEVQADDYHLPPTTSFQYSVDHFIIGREHFIIALQKLKGVGIQERNGCQFFETLTMKNA